MTKGSHMATIEEIIKEVEDAIEDAKADFPEVADIDIVHEVAAGVLLAHSGPAADEVRRIYGLNL
jgi:hypothetical protein